MFIVKKNKFMRLINLNFLKFFYKNKMSSTSIDKKERMNIDNYIEKLLNFNFLLESELKDLCDKVNKFEK